MKNLLIPALALTVAGLCLCGIVLLNSIEERTDNMQQYTYNTQKIDLEGVANARQLGGYVIGGRTVRQDVLLRSGNLSMASDAAVDSLVNRYHVAHVFDFRSSIERDSAPDREISGSCYHSLPCLEQMLLRIAAAGKLNVKPSGDVNKIAEDLLDMVIHPEVKQMADSMYPAIVFDEAAQHHYGIFLKTLASMPDGKAAIWHCSQGKDRCGWASALLLAALGAERDLIVADFALSNVGYQDMIDRTVAKAQEMGLAEDHINTIYAMIGVSVDNFNSTYDAIISRYGSMDTYLTDFLGCDRTMREVLRSKFLQ